jgi:hypothetical protein
MSVNIQSKKYGAGEYIERGSACIIETNGNVYLFDITDPSHNFKYVGVAYNTCSQGQIVDIVQEGFLGWSGAPYQKGVVYYVGSDSKLTATPPVTGLVKQIGIGLPSTVVDKQPVQAITITREYSNTSSTAGSGCMTIDCGSFLDPNQSILIDAGGFNCP